MSFTSLSYKEKNMLEKKFYSDYFKTFCSVNGNIIYF